MTAPLSSVLPSLPPAEGLSVLDPRFPIRLSEPARIFWQLTGEWDDRETVIGQTIRATQQHTDDEERFIQPLPATRPVAAVTAPLPPVPYRELDEDTLTHEWDTGPGTAILTSGEPARHRRHQLKGPDGRFIARENGAA